MTQMIPTLRDPFQPGDNPLHRLDARLKVVMTIGLVAGIVLTPERAWPAYPLLWAIVGSLAAAGRLSVWALARKGSVALPFVLAAVPLAFTTPGPAVAEILGAHVSETGLLRVTAILLKSWLSVQAVALLIITTPFTDLLWALSALRVPATLIAVMGLMYRYLFVLSDEASRLLRARAARSAAIPGRRAGGRVAWRAQVAGSMVGNLFLRSYERSERVYAAMLARGYAGQAWTPTPPPLVWRAALWGVLPILAVVTVQVLARLAWSG